MPGGEFVVYEAPNGEVRVDVRLDQETVWLSLSQLAELFGRDKSVISRHLRNVFASGELEREATVARNATVQREGDREIVRDIGFFNLDVFLSVGYRVNSKRGTQFRIWATRTLREHLVKGYTLDRQRFAQNAAELEAALALVRKAAAGEALTTDQGRGLVDVIARYTQTFLLLQRYDEGLLAEPKGNSGGVLLVADAAHLLYFVIKNHPFSDGNKRIGSFLFVDFLNRNGRLFRNSEAVINDVGLAALALLVAESAPADKEVMIRLVMNMLAGPL